MKVTNYNYKGKPIRVLTELLDKGILFNTKDICTILNIKERPSGSDLSSSCLDLASAVNIVGSYNKDFAIWLNETFIEYNINTLVHPKCNDDWDFS